MSPRRMDISSLLRDPSPPSPNDDHTQSLPPSLLTILNTPHIHHNPQQQDRGPFLGLDALVHVASEERRRISLQDDNDRHHASHLYPRPHKRPRDTCPPSPPRSPSPPRIFPPHSTSPSTRHHSSASPTIIYPTLRTQPINLPRSTPALLPEPRHTPSLPPQRSSPFSQLPPSLASPHHHSPQLLRSHFSSPIHSAPPEPDAMSPRFGCGPRMAGGINVLSSDPSPMRDPPRSEFSFYQSPRRDLSAERLLGESHPDHARHDLRLSPLSTRAFSLDDDKHQANPPSQESVFLRERARPRHFPPADTTMDNPKTLAKEPDLPFPEPHPIRVWEEQSTTREAPRLVSPARIPSTVSGLAVSSTWPPACESRLAEGAAVERQDAIESDTCEEPRPPHHPTSGPLTFNSQTPVEEIRFDPQPTLPISVQSESQAHHSLASLLNCSTPLVSASPALNLHLKNFEAEPVLRPSPEMQLEPSNNVPPTPCGPIVTESVSEPIHVSKDPDTNPVADALFGQPSPAVQPLEPGMFEMSTHPIHVDTLQKTSRSPSHQLTFAPLAAKDEDDSPLEDIQVPTSTQPEVASRQSPESEHTTKREQPASGHAMDVDEELLNLVEDHPAHAPPAMRKAQHDSKLPPPITVSQASDAGAQRSSQASDGGSSSVPSSQPVLKGPLITGPLITGEEKDRTSMPPPAPRNRKAEKDNIAVVTSTAVGSKKKKDGTSKIATKPKQPPKTRAKFASKLKVKSNAVDSPKVVALKGVVNANVNGRSRSASVIPGAVDDVVPEPEADESDKEDDKLYCVCKTRYDEDRMMIACDRCDEWFHTVCVNMPDLEIDLVDQFICPPCVQIHPHLRTTWKRRCLFGLQHEEPSSPEACHKPSRGTFSKYCSDNCGIKSMQGRIAQWEKSGGVRDLLWESVKNAAKREGVVVCAMTNGPVEGDHLEPKPLGSTAEGRAEREVARLNTCLDEVGKERELMKRELEMVTWREKVVELASERAGKVDECGWDQRLCFGEEEWADFGEEVLQSYGEERVKVESGDAMPLDGTSAMHGEWWCTGKKKCERHAGWQKLRAAEVSFDKETKEGILLKLTTREREIRRSMEDIHLSEVRLNGPRKPRPTDHVSERGKKKSSS